MGVLGSIFKDSVVELGNVTVVSGAMSFTPGIRGDIDHVVWVKSGW